MDDPTAEDAETLQSLEIRAKLDGPRFKRHKIPLAVLADLARFEPLLIEAAKQDAREARGRTNAPKHFLKGLAFELDVLGKGSTLTPICVVREEQDTLFDQHWPHIVGGVERVQRSFLAAAEGDEATIQKLLPDRALELFRSLGTTLTDQDTLIFGEFKGRPVPFTRSSRKVLQLARTDATHYVDRVRLYGVVEEADTAKRRFRLKVDDGTSQEISHTPALSATVGEAFAATARGEYFPVRIDEDASYNRAGRLLGVEPITALQVLPVLDPGARLSSFKAYRDGWYDGQGTALDDGALDLLASAFERFYPDPDDFEPPHLYADPDGGVRAEWDRGTRNVNLDITLNPLRGDLFAFDTDDDGVELEEPLNLAASEGWSRLLEVLDGHLGGGAA